MRDAAQKYLKLLLKDKNTKKYVELYKVLWGKFKEARAKGHGFKFHWLCSKPQQIHKEMKGGDEISSIKAHIVVHLLTKYKRRMHQRQRNKNLSKQDKESDLKKCHATYRERCIRFGKDETYDSKWGRFKPTQRLNLDQSPLPFVINMKKT